MYLVGNERVKLTASWFNALAVALVAAGSFAPAAAALYGLPARAPSFTRTTLGIVCFAVGVCLHLTGRLVLKRLRE
jgi:hypothetical protein